MEGIAENRNVTIFFPLYLEYPFHRNTEEKEMVKRDTGASASHRHQPATRGSEKMNTETKGQKIARLTRLVSGLRKIEDQVRREHGDDLAREIQIRWKQIEELIDQA